MYGSWILIRRIPKTDKAEAVCPSCKETRIICYYSLKHEPSKKCRQCWLRPNQNVPMSLYTRVHAIHRRCTDTEDERYKDYGGRGIKFCFSSINEMSEYMYNLPGYKAEMSIDRINNDGHYEPGNLRWATKKQQSGNRRNTLISADFLFNQEEWPYGENTTLRLFRQGFSRKEIIERAETSVKMKSKNWSIIKNRLEVMKKNESIFDVADKHLRSYQTLE